MHKVFLSHSSKDKGFVRKVAEKIGLNFCVIDECEFEAGMRNIDEIFKGIEKSDIFVYFISDNSLKSDWVKKELNIANEKVVDFSKKKIQIFPIIIDKNITHSDERIADYLRLGEDSYNLRHVLRPEIAARKIRTQLVKLEMAQDRRYEEKKNYFYGRDEEKLQLKRRIDDVMNEAGVRCAVIAGIPGIGRRSFAIAALKDAGIIEKYYFPMTISLNRTDSIDNLLRGLNNQGIGGYSLQELASIKTMDEKIDALAEMLEEIQRYQEILVIDDSNCIITITGNIVYWFEQAILKIKSKLSVIVISEVKLDEFNYKKKQEFAHIALKEMNKSDTLGMLRTYSKLEGIPFEKEDREALSDCLSGYPPQIQYCVALAQKEGVDYVRNNTHEIVNMPEQVSSKLISIAYDGLEKERVNCLLALIVKFGTMPVTIMNKIISINNSYKDAFYRLRALSICYYIGNEKEYIKLNSFLQNFVERNKFEILDDVKEIIKQNIEMFEKNISDENYTDELDYSEIDYYVKELLKEEKVVPEIFLYGTVFLQSLISLYKDSHYRKVIKIVNNLIENNQMIAYEEEVEDRIRYYYCLALARVKEPTFDSAVSYFSQEERHYCTYNFLKGYNYRIRGYFEQAEKSYLNVLRKNAKDMKTLRELVFIYVSCQQYETAIELAQSNYKRNRNNIHYMQAYFECLVNKKIRNEEEEKDLKEIITIVNMFYREVKINSMYYQILGKYEAFVKGNQQEAINYIDEGIHKNSAGIISYLLKERFDIFEHFSDLSGMRESLKRLGEELEKQEMEDSRLNNILFGRKALLWAHEGKSKISIQVELAQNTKLSESAREKILSNVDKIISGQSILY